MDINSIVWSAVSIGGLGLVFGLGLGQAAKIFEVKVDPKVPEVRDALPGANCGACGYAGCDAFAKAIVEGTAPLNGCPVGGSSVAANLGAIMGQVVEEKEKTTAYIKCQGTCDRARQKYDYAGVMDCKNATFMQGKGDKACEFGCLGLGSCVQACDYGAIDIIDGIAVINEAKCVSCGMCVKACPKQLIEIVPLAKKVRVSCASLDKGKAAKESCATACIACKMCVKACQFDAITVENNIAHIDYSKCTQCNACTLKCPTKAIVNLGVDLEESAVERAEQREEQREEQRPSL